MAKFDIQLKGCYLFRGMPFLRVTFIDVCKALEFINHDAFREAIVTAKRTELLHDWATGTLIPFVTGLITEPVSHCMYCIYVLVNQFIALYQRVIFFV